MEKKMENNTNFCTMFPSTSTRIVAKYEVGIREEESARVRDRVKNPSHAQCDD